MIKTVTLLKRRSDLTRDEFVQHWRTVHAALVLDLPGVVGYVQGRVVAKAWDTDIDGVADVWYESLESMRATLGSAAYASLLADEAYERASQAIRTISASLTGLADIKGVGASQSWVRT
jgi:uncharacterized protein (TIGR02118 family)